MGMIEQLEAIIKNRREIPQEGSYTNQLLESGRNKMAQKVGEEGVEVVIAALGQGREEQIGEIADLIYHLLVLMNDLDITLDDVEKKLAERHQSKE